MQKYQLTSFLKTVNQVIITVANTCNICWFSVLIQLFPCYVQG